MGVIDLRRWTGSLVTALDPEQLTPGDFSVLENFIYDANGLPIVRGGRRKWNAATVTNEFNGLYQYDAGWVSGVPASWMIGYAGTQIYKATETGVWTSIFTGLQAGLRPTFTTFRGWLIAAMGAGSSARPLFWDGSMDTMDVLPGAPTAATIASHAGRLWMCSLDYPSRIYYSAPYDPTKWDTTYGGGWVETGPGDGNSNVAIVGGFAGELIVFKDGPGGGSIYRIQGLAEPFSVSPLSSTLGAVSAHSAALIGDRDIMFASRRGLHSLKRTFEHGDLESSFIDAEVSDRWRSLTLAQKQRATCVDDFPTDTWWLFVDTDSDKVNDRGWLFNYRHKGPRGNPKVSDVTYGTNCAAVFSSRKSNLNTLMTGGTGYTYLEHMKEANDDGTDFAWKAKLSPIDGGEPFKMKAWQEVWLRYDTWGEGTATVTWYGDNRPPSSTTISLNPNRIGTPQLGDMRVGEWRFAQKGMRSMSVIQLMEGGIALNLEIEGTRGRTSLRGARFMVDPGTETISAGEWFGYSKTTTPAFPS